MTLQAIEKQLKSVRPLSSHENRVYMALMRDFPPLAITNSEKHKYFSEILNLISREMVNLEQMENLPANGLEYFEALSQYASIVAELIEHYEKRKFPVKASGREVLRFLMEQNDIAQSELGKELGGQPVVSDILSGKRFLNVNQIQLLANRFKISPASFFPVK